MSESSKFGLSAIRLKWIKTWFFNTIFTHINFWFSAAKRPFWKNIVCKCVSRCEKPQIYCNMQFFFMITMTKKNQDEEFVWIRAEFGLSAIRLKWIKSWFQNARKFGLSEIRLKCVTTVVSQNNITVTRRSRFCNFLF